MYYLGIDLGGTHMAAGVINDSYEIIARAKQDTIVPCSHEEMTEQLSRVALDALKNAGISVNDLPWIGVGTPGSVNRSTGIVGFAGNLYLKNYELVKRLSERMKCRVIVENDANAAAYGEYMAGAMKGAKSALAITLGTGIGSGIILDGKIYGGCNFAAGEMGHIVIEYNGRLCTCGRRGCWETYASATGLITTTRLFMQKASNKESPIWHLINGDLKKINGRTAFDAMRAGDPLGKEIVDTYIGHLGCGIVNCINTFQPDILCIGGGICNEGETLLKPLRAYVEKEVFSVPNEKATKLKVAQLGNDAGIIGAALLGK